MKFIVVQKNLSVQVIRPANKHYYDGFLTEIHILSQI